ncbi:MAG: GNAT family N-acetyltransferase [Prevotella sp.]|nr:GNAT family N-acetyltransferase [Prevotella sp.]
MMEKIVRLRAIEPEDLDALYMIENDRSLWNVGRTNVPYSRYTLHDYIAHASSDIYTDRQVRLIIEDERGEVMGIADIVSFDPQHLRAELGIVIKTAYRRQGVAKAAVKDILQYALEILHLHQVYVIIDEQNAAAQNLFNKLAFKESARLTDWLYDGNRYHDAILLQRIL